MSKAVNTCHNLDNTFKALGIEAFVEAPRPKEGATAESPTLLGNAPINFLLKIRHKKSALKT
ncbi:hypothetical protein BWZ22_08735 [Seonamhaeicola sp. S2-3]|nr:hypothetical protein BWZ22_08735 [Seonamhaeicola sp. S2-3]